VARARDLRRRSGPPRRQAERSAAMRERILAATGTALLRRGYAGTTTVEVCRRAGISRGALLHHFPTRAALLVAALERLRARRIERNRERLAALGSSRDPAGAAVDYLWAAVTDPEYPALFELQVAARTDPGLRRALRRLAERWEAENEQAARALFPALRGAPDAGARASALVHALRGLALEPMQGTPEARWRPVLDAIKAMARRELGRASPPEGAR